MIDIQKIIKVLAKEDIGILITDHNVRETLEICHEAAILMNGEIIAKGGKKDLIENNLVKKVYLGNMYNSVSYTHLTLPTTMLV